MERIVINARIDIPNRIGRVVRVIPQLTSYECVKIARKARGALWPIAPELLHCGDPLGQVRAGVKKMN
jgi:hypothetical protein